MKFASVLFAEAVAGQEEKIAWIYLNLIEKNEGEAGLSRSAAYTHKSDNYKISMTALGDTQYSNDKPKDKWLIDTKSKTIQDYIDNNSFAQKIAVPRTERIKELVEKVTNSADNPYAGWTGQGNLDDFNNKSNGDIYWKRARAYYWLQEKGQVAESLVEVLEAGANTQFIFNGDKIEEYFRDNPDKMPKDVPSYERKHGKKIQ